MMSTQIQDTIGSQQLTLNIRTIFDKAQEELFPRYEKQIQLLKNVKGSIATYINDSDCAQVYQYYAVSPNYLLEARMLRRMDIAVSVVCIREAISANLYKNYIQTIEFDDTAGQSVTGIRRNGRDNKKRSYSIFSKL